jgi:hypothetical protein
MSALRLHSGRHLTSAQARAVLAAIGGGERSFTNIARAAGALPIQRFPAPLTR